MTEVQLLGVEKEGIQWLCSNVKMAWLYVAGSITASFSKDFFHFLS